MARSSRSGVLGSPTVDAPHVDSEVGALRTVVLHRPGPELERLTPRNADRLLFDGIPWVERAQVEHDAFADLLRAHGVRVLLLGGRARRGAREPGRARGRDRRRRRRARAGHASSARRCAPSCTGSTTPRWPTALIGGRLVRRAGCDGTLTGARHGARRTTSPSTRCPTSCSPATRRSGSARASWRRRWGCRRAGGRPRWSRSPSATTRSSASSPRPRPATRPRSRAATCCCSRPGCWRSGSASARAPPAPSRSRGRCSPTASPTPCSRSRSPSAGRRCTSTRWRRWSTPTRWSSTRACSTGSRRGRCARTGTDHLDIRGPRAVPARPRRAPWAIDELRAVDTGLESVAAEREQWDDGNNTLALAPGRVVAYERNTTTNARLEAAGIEVLTIAGFELGSGRGGPRCLSCPWERAPVE